MDLRLIGDDIYIQARDLQLVSGLDALAQRLLVRLRTFKGEWYVDGRWGVPFYQGVLLKGALKSKLESIFRKAILDTPGVKSLTKFALDYDTQTRELSIEFEAQADEGTVAVSETL